MSIKNFLIVLCMSAIYVGCGEEEERNCITTVECGDEKEMYCDEPVSTEFEDGTVVTLRACTYATYEHCFEKTECTGG